MAIVQFFDSVKEGVIMIEAASGAFGAPFRAIEIACAQEGDGMCVITLDRLQQAQG